MSTPCFVLCQGRYIFRIRYKSVACSCGIACPRDLGQMPCDAVLGRDILCSPSVGSRGPSTLALLAAVLPRPRSGRVSRLACLVGSGSFRSGLHWQRVLVHRWPPGVACWLQPDSCTMPSTPEGIGMGSPLWRGGMIWGHREMLGASRRLEAIAVLPCSLLPIVFLIEPQRVEDLPPAILFTFCHC